MVYKTKITIMF